MKRHTATTHIKSVLMGIGWLSLVLCPWSLMALIAQWLSPSHYNPALATASIIASTLALGFMLVLATERVSGSLSLKKTLHR